MPTSNSYYMHPKFVFKEGARVKGGLDAQTVGEELARIEADAGGITPEAVVDAARDESAPLHPAFTWDDAEAAEAHRRNEARNLVRVVRIEAPEVATPVPAFVHVTRVDEGAGRASVSYYTTSSQVAATPDLFESAWRAANDRIAAATRSLQDLENLATIHGRKVEAVKAAVASLAEAGEALAS